MELKCLHDVGPPTLAHGRRAGQARSVCGDVTFHTGRHARITLRLDNGCVALACARGMLAALASWNREREAAGQAPLRMGLGLHFGPVVLGDVGSERSMAFATVGDTINVASRLQSMTRDLDTTLVVSGALASRVREEAAEVSLLDGLTNRGPHVLRGHHATVEVWAGS